MHITKVQPDGKAQIDHQTRHQQPNRPHHQRPLNFPPFPFVFPPPQPPTPTPSLSPAARPHHDLAPALPGPTLPVPPPRGHDPPHLPAPRTAKAGVGLHDAFAAGQLQAAAVAVEEPGDLEADVVGGVDEGEEAGVGVLEGEGVGVGEVGGDEEVEFGGEGEEGCGWLGVFWR